MEKEVLATAAKWAEEVLKHEIIGWTFSRTAVITIPLLALSAILAIRKRAAGFLQHAAQQPATVIIRADGRETELIVLPGQRIVCIVQRPR